MALQLFNLEILLMFLGMTDNGTGDYTISINNDLANDDYAEVMGQRTMIMAIEVF